MTWQTYTGRRHRGGGSGNGESANQRQLELRRLAQELKQAFFRAPDPQKRAEWHCKGCSTSNYEDRRACRRCGETRGSAGRPAARVPPSFGAGPRAPAGSAQANSQTGANRVAAPMSYAAAVVHGRGVAPERRVADAEARASSLECAADLFNEAGLEDRARQLSDEAAAIRKKDGQAPPAGCRLDMLTGYVERAERRQVRATEAVLAAEQQLLEAKRHPEDVAKEVEDGKAQLAKLRAELAAVPADPEAAAVAVAADAEAIAIGTEASDALSRARKAMESAEWSPLTLRAMQLPAALGAAIFAARAAPPLDSPLDAPTTFFVHDTLESRIRDAGLASARAAAAAAGAPRAAAPVSGTNASEHAA